MLRLRRSLLTVLLLLSACGGSTGEPDVNGQPAAPGRVSVPEVNPLTEPLTRSDYNSEEQVRLTAATPVAGEVVVPAFVTVDPEDTTRIVVGFVGGDPNCTAALLNVLESDVSVAVETVVGLSADAAARQCAAGEFSLWLEARLNAPLGDRELIAVEPVENSDDKQFELKDLIGMSQADAEALLDLQGRNYRVNTGELLTADYVPDRLTLTLADGMVTTITVG